MKSYSQNKSKPTAINPTQKADPKETAQEAIHQVMSKADAQIIKAKAARKQAASPPMKAAKGDDDLMSQPQKKS